MIAVQGSLVTLLKFQMVPRDKLLISSGSNKRNSDVHVSVKPKAHTHRECEPRFHPLHTCYIQDY